MKTLNKLYEKYVESWKIKCPKCGSVFSDEVKKKLGKVQCPKCGNETKLQYINKD